MKPKGLYVFSANDTLAPSTLTENFRTLERNIASAQAERYTYSTFVLDWSDAASAKFTSTPDTLKYSFTAPFAYEIVSQELIFSAGAAMTAVAVTTTGGVVVGPVDAPTINTRASASDFTVIANAANVNRTFVLSVGTFTSGFNSCRLTVTIRTDRLATVANFQPTMSQYPRVGQTTDVTTLNTLLTSAQAAADALKPLTGANGVSYRMAVFQWREQGTGATSNAIQQWRYPQSKSKLIGMEGGVIIAATSQITFDFRDFDNTTIFSFINKVGGGATVLSTSSNSTVYQQTQGGGPNAIVQDSNVHITRTVGTDDQILAYLFLYFAG